MNQTLVRRIMCEVRAPAFLFVLLFVAACTDATPPPSLTPHATATNTAPIVAPSGSPRPTTPALVAARLVTTAGDFALLSPDGTTLVSKSQRDKVGTNAIVFQSINGTILRQIPDDRASGRMQWLPDSSGVFVELAAGQRAGPLGIISVDGGVLETGLDYANPALSPDGRWIAAEHQEGCCAGIRIREIWVVPRSGGAPRTLVTSSTPQDVLQPMSLLGWDAQGGLLFRDGDAFGRVTLDGVRTPVVAPNSARGRVVTASAVSPDNAVILLCAVDPLAWWTLANGRVTELPRALRPAWRTREPWCSRADEVPWYRAHLLVLKDVASTPRTFDATSGSDRPFPLVPVDAVLSASTYILLASVGQDVWIMSGTGGLPTGLRAQATDLLVFPIANSGFFVRAGSAAYVVAMPGNASRDPSWKSAPELRFPRSALPENNVWCGLVGEKLTAPGEGVGGTIITPVASAASGVTQGTLVGLPDDAPPTGSYVCLRVRPGAPMAGFVAWVRPGEPDYLPRSVLVPTGFLLPQSCAYLGDPAPDQRRDEVVWRIDCGAAPDMRAALAPVLTDQSWTLCGSGFGVAIWTKDARTLTITQASANGDSHATLGLRTNSDCP